MKAKDWSQTIATHVLPAYADIAPGATVRRFGSGLINETFLVESGDARYVLQWVNPIFPPTIHDNIEAMTAHLAARGMITPRLVRTRAGTLALAAGDHGIWRLMTHIEGVSFDVIVNARQARAAGALVGRFHQALETLQHTFEGRRLGVHDTPKHLAHLREMVRVHGAHRLIGSIGPLAARIQAAAEAMPPLPTSTERPCHGDLKFNNILFAGATGADAERAVCLIDLDTAGPMPLGHELGDALRSWGNRNGENNEVAALDLAIMGAALAGYREGVGRRLSEEEKTALLLGVEWISLELSARFAADALAEQYFGWDTHAFAGRGEHNRVRALGQFSLFEALVATRETRTHMLTEP